MKTIGMLGGMSWESTAVYYRIMNEEVRRRLGGLHSARILMYSADFAPLEQMLRAERWEQIGDELALAARKLQEGGADLLVIATNTMHHVADRVEAALTVPLVHIADSAGRELVRCGLLLGTRFTMEMDFYHRRLRDVYSADTLVPDADERVEINRIIFEELCRGVLSEDSSAAIQAIIRRTALAGAQAVVLGCTELPLIVRPADTPLPVFDTMRLHALDAVGRALEGETTPAPGT
jgi:aspartate racemase